MANFAESLDGKPAGIVLLTEPRRQPDRDPAFERTLRLDAIGQIAQYPGGNRQTFFASRMVQDAPFLPKPFSLVDLTRKVRQVLDAPGNGHNH